MSLDQALFDEVIENALYILRLSAGERAKVIAQLLKMQRDLVRQLADSDITAYSKAKIELFLKESDEIVSGYYDKVQADLDFKAIGQATVAHIASGFEIVMGVDALAVPKPSFYKSLASDVLVQGAPSADWWRGQSQGLQTKFKAEVRKGLANGETNQQIISRIVGKSGQPGIMETSRREAANLVQTSVQTVANDSRRGFFEANDDIIKGIKQVSTLDGHTSTVCIAYSGASWKLDKTPLNGSPPYNGGTPRHWNCRSVETPITKTFKELGLDIPEPEGTTRASMDGQVAFGTTFDDFLGRKTKGFQDKLLGPGRAELWRSGKITLRDLVNGDGQPMSVEQLLELARSRKRS